MLKGKWKILICIALVTCVIFTASNNVFAAINESYLVDTPATDANLEDKVSNSVVLDAIGAFIYAVGSLMEFLLGKVFQLITQTNMFPWADAILFNAVPFLDINIFNGAEKSLVSMLYDFLTGTYYSLLTLASTFFGIAVMFSAIKLAITAIAEDKAKYKKAIVDWILGLVMLWGIHFFISFVLYLNEQLVVVASNIASESIAEAGEQIASLRDTTEYNTKIVQNFITLMLDDTFTLKKFLAIAAIVIGTIALIALAITGVGAIVQAVVAAGIIAGEAAAATATLATVVTGISTFSSELIAGAIWLGVGVAGATSVTYGVVDSVDIAPALIATSKAVESAYDAALDELKNEDIDDIVKRLYKDTFTYSSPDGKTYSGNVIDVAAGLLKNSTYREYRFPGAIITEDGFWQWKDKQDAKYVRILYLDTLIVCGNAFTLENADNSGDRADLIPIELYRVTYMDLASIPVADRTEDNFDQELYNYAKALCDVQDAQILSKTSETNIIYNLAMYFKETAFTTSETGWVANKTVIQNAIMYVLLVCYSLVFFISYTKRLFYVIMLILMAPIVVVFDFFMKFGK